MKKDPKTGEEVVFVFKHDLLPMLLFNYHILGYSTFPTYSMLFLAVGLASFSLLGYYVLSPTVTLTTIGSVLFLSLVGAVFETINKRVFMTSSRIVRQYGIFGEKRIELPFETLNHINFKVLKIIGKPGFYDTGTIYFYEKGRDEPRISAYGVFNPKELTTRIQDFISSQGDELNKK